MGFQARPLCVLITLMCFLGLLTKITTTNHFDGYIKNTYVTLQSSGKQQIIKLQTRLQKL